VNKKLLILIGVGTLFVTLTAAHAKTTLMQIGRSPFYRPPLTTSETLLTMVQTREKDVKTGFEKAGMVELFKPFMAQIASAQIDTVKFHKGDTFKWMLFKKKGLGAVRVARDVTWGNEEPFTGFKFSIENGGKAYMFAVPLGCGNIAFVGAKSPVTPLAPVAPVAASKPVAVSNKDPECKMVVSSTEEFCGEQITVDASSSVDPDGEIIGMTIGVIDAQGTVVSETKIKDGALIGYIPMPCGANTIKTTITDNRGASATSDACNVAVNGTNRVRLVADLGYYNMPDPGNYLFGRIGMEYKFSENWGILAMVGAAPQIEGIDGVSAFLIDVLGEYSYSRYFVNLGVGGWLTDGDQDLETENSQLDFIAGVGARVYGEPEDFNASLFLEVRAAFDEFDHFVDYGRFGFGVRFRF